MPFSYYLKKFSCKEKPGFLILFSTKRGGMVFLREEVFLGLENGLSFPKEEDSLKNLGIWVSSQEEE
ncbi:MAG: hypothetical protein HYZ54_11375, partial [Ignavibacteriae bacterium]|nr:hypothetical protein [Ignavibacteriota bacterium]